MMAAADAGMLVEAMVARSISPPFEHSVTHFQSNYFDVFTITIRFKLNGTLGNLGVILFFLNAIIFAFPHQFLSQ